MGVLYLKQKIPLVPLQAAYNHKLPRPGVGKKTPSTEPINIFFFYHN